MNPISFIIWLAGLAVFAVMFIQTPRPRKIACLPLGLLLVWLALLLEFLIKTPHAVSFTWN